jgi:multiple sugar transport system permease protein
MTSTTSVRPLKGPLHLGMKTGRRVQQVLSYIFVFLAVGIAILPLLWMISTAFKTVEQLRVTLPIQWIPNPVTFQNFVVGLSRQAWLRYLSNTLFWAIASLIPLMASCTLVSYAFARMRFKGRDPLMLLNISLMLLPYQVTMVPTFVLMSKLGWIGTWLPGIVPFAFAASPWYVFLLRQFFRAIPEELSDAARIDGCGDLGILLRIIVPLSKPVLALMAATHIQWCWNELLFPLLYFKDESHRTLTLAMQVFIQARGDTDWGPMMAMALLIALPMVAVYYVSQRQFVSSFALSGITG